LKNTLKEALILFEHVILTEQLIHSICRVEDADWQKYELILEATDTDHQGMLVLASSEEGTFWLDQVSAFPLDTYKVCPQAVYK
jgi:hypothetical protein